MISQGQDLVYMRRALQLAQRGPLNPSPNPRVGCILVKDGRVIGEGYHRGPGTPHAEVEAINSATGDVAGATLYLSLEPCAHYGKTPPCAPFIAEKGIVRVVAATEDPNPLVAGQGFSILSNAGVAVDTGICADEAMRLNEAFMTFHKLRRPFLISKWAMTLDGRIAADSGHSKWVSNEKSRAYVHELRAGVDAVLVGIGTVLVDNPMLTVRLPNYSGRQPLRVIADGSLRIPLKASCLEHTGPGQCLIATTASAPKDRFMRLADAGFDLMVVAGNKGLLDANSLIEGLRDRGIQSVLCEGGSSLNSSLFQSGLVDKIVAFVAPKIIGGTAAKSPITGWGLDRMDAAIALHETRFRQFGNDICIEGYFNGLFGAQPTHESSSRLGVVTPAGEL